MALGDLALLGLVLGGLTPARLSAFSRQLSEATMLRLQRMAFRKMVRFAGRRSRYYRERFKTAGIDPRAVRRPEDLGDFHTPTKDLVERCDDFICDPPLLAFESTGTTGRNKRVFFSAGDWRRAARNAAAGFYSIGMRPGDRALNTFTFSYWISGLSSQAAAARAGVFCLPVGKSEPEEAFGKIAQYRADVVLGLPAYIVRLNEIAEREGVPRPLKLVVTSADWMSDAVRDWTERLWGCRVFRAYGASEAGGGIAMECPAHAGYHYDMHNTLCEVRDADADGWGNLTVSWLSARCMPIIRAPLGDVARIERGRCACGAASHRISYLRGRVDEMFKIAGYNLYPDFICRAFEGVPGITPDYQGVVTLRGQRPVLTMNFELRPGADQAALDAKLRGNLAALAPDLWECFTNRMADFEIEFRAPGTVRIGRKLLRFVDKRSK